MPQHFIEHHRHIVTWGASLFLLAMVLGNSLLFLHQLNQPYANAPDNPIQSLPNGQLLASGATASQQGGNQLPLLVSVAGMATFALGLGGFNLVMIKRAEQRDHQRRRDLADLAAALEAYYAEYGHYPLSSSYEDGYYKAILITNEWHYYDLPAAEVMKTYLAQWPLTDPSVPLNSKDQAGNYLYYPQDHGQRFSLYAALERSGDETVAEQDGLGDNLALYNYRLASQRGPASSPAPAAIQADQATEPQPAPDALAAQQPSPAAAPVIQSTTLPLDVRLAQGTAEQVALAGPPSDQPDQPTPASSQAELQPGMAPTMPAPAPAPTTLPRRQLVFSQPASTADPTAAPPSPADPLSDMLPLFFGPDEDLQ